MWSNWIFANSCKRALDLSAFATILRSAKYMENTVANRLDLWMAPICCFCLGSHAAFCMQFATYSIRLAKSKSIVAIFLPFDRFFRFPGSFAHISLSWIITAAFRIGKNKTGLWKSNWDHWKFTSKNRC